MRRRIALLAVVALGICLVTGVIGTQASTPIRIGALGPRTGVFASFGEHMMHGVTLALEEASYRVAGRQILLFTEDTGGNVEQTVTKLKALHERDRVHVIVGPMLGSEGIAAVDWAKGTGVPVVVAYSAPEDITMRNRVHNVVRPGWTGAQPMFPFGEYAARELGYKRIVSISQDYSFPYNQVGGFIRGFLGAGGEEVVKVWFPVGTDDYSSIIARLPRNVDAALIVSAGSDMIAFFRQWKEFGMDRVMPLLASSNAVDSTILPELGRDAIGILSSMHYAEGLNTPQFNKFKNAFMKRWGYMPSAPAEHGYVSTKWVLKAIEARKGDVEDRAAFINALRAVEMPDAPRGPIKLDAYGNAVQNIYIRQVQLVDGQLVNVPIKTIPNVSQFGPYVNDPEGYMSQPPDSRTYPPGRR